MATSAQTAQNSLERLLDSTLKSINDADTEAAAARVAGLRDQLTASGDDEQDRRTVVERLIKQKTLQAGMVGATTSGAAIIPGIGSIAALTLGTAADVGVTLRLQADLVLEIAAAHGHELSDQERRSAMMLVTGANLGTERLVNQASRRLARKASERFAGRALVKVIPFVGVAASAGANMVTTYAIGKRADAYFGLEPDAGNLDESMRALTGVDERKLAAWLEEVMVDVGRTLNDGARRAGQSAAQAGRAAASAIGGGVSALRARRARLREQRHRRDDEGAV